MSKMLNAEKHAKQFGLPAAKSESNKSERRPSAESPENSNSELQGMNSKLDAMTQKIDVLEEQLVRNEEHLVQQIRILDEARYEADEPGGAQKVFRALLALAVTGLVVWGILEGPETWRRAQERFAVQDRAEVPAPNPPMPAEEPAEAELTPVAEIAEPERIFEEAYTEPVIEEAEAIENDSEYGQEALPDWVPLEEEPPFFEPAPEPAFQAEQDLPGAAAPAIASDTPPLSAVEPSPAIEPTAPAPEAEPPFEPTAMEPEQEPVPDPADRPESGKSTERTSQDELNFSFNGAFQL